MKMRKIMRRDSWEVWKSFSRFESFDGMEKLDSVLERGKIIKREVFQDDDDKEMVKKSE
jgi:hypothetical protein